MKIRTIFLAFLGFSLLLGCKKEESSTASTADPCQTIAISNWQTIPFEEDLIIGATDVSFPTNETGYIIGAQGGMIKTTDGGAIWEKVDLPTTSDLTSVSFVDQEVGYLIAGEEFLATKNGELNNQLATSTVVGAGRSEGVLWTAAGSAP